MRRVAKILITVGIIALCACIYPLCLTTRETSIDPTLGLEYEVTEKTGHELIQTFVAQSNYLSDLVFDIRFPDGIPEDGSLFVRIYEEQETRKLIFERELSIQEVTNNAFTYVSVEKRIRKGDLYSYTLTSCKETPVAFQALYTLDIRDATPGNQQLFFDGELINGQAVTRYVYGFPLNYKNVLCIWAFLGTVGLILLELLSEEKNCIYSKFQTKVNSILDIWQIPVLVLELFFVALMLVRISRNEMVHWDEAYTWRMVTRNSLPEMIKSTAMDVHPPLYYMLVMAAMKLFGQSIYVAKLVSVAGSVATAVLGVTLVRKRWGVKTAIPFILVSGFAPQLIYYSVDVRMYSWMCFFVIAAGLFAYEIMETGKIFWWIAFTLMALGGVYTQYFSVVPLAIIYICLLVQILICDRTQIVKWIGCCIATILGYAPWLGVVFDTMQRDATDAKGNEFVINIQAICNWAFKSNIEFSEFMPAILFVVSAFCFIIDWKKFTKNQRIFLIFTGSIIFFSLMMCAFLANQMNHFWHNRYLVDVLLFVWLFILIMLPRRNIVAWGLLMIWLGISMLSSYTVMNATELGTIPWIQASKNILEQVQEEDRIVYTFPTFDVLYEYYIPNAEFVWFEDVDLSTWDKDEFYMLDWGGTDFPWYLYENGILEKQLMGSMRLEQGICTDLWKITIQDRSHFGGEL